METLLITAVCAFIFLYTYFSKKTLKTYILKLCEALEDTGRIIYLQTEILTKMQNDLMELENKIKKLTPKESAPKKKKTS